MFGFMKKDKDRDLEEKERKKKEKREKKEAKKKEQLTPDELSRLEEAKKGLFGLGRKSSDKQRYKSPYTADIFGGRSKRSSLPSASGSDGSSTSVGKSQDGFVSQSHFYTSEIPIGDVKNNHSNKDAVAFAHGRNGELTGDQMDSLRGSKRGILKESSKYSVDGKKYIKGNPDDTQDVEDNTHLNENVGALIIKLDGGDSHSILQAVPPSIKVNNTCTTSSDGGSDDVDFHCNLFKEKKFNAELHLPILVPPKPPRSHNLNIMRQKSGDFGFSLRRSVIVERNPVDNREYQKNVIFAEPGLLGNKNHTGLLPGDLLVEVNGTNAEQMSRDEVIELIKHSGNAVQLTVQPVLELSELTMRPGWELGNSGQEEHLRVVGNLARTGSMNYSDNQVSGY